MRAPRAPRGGRKCSHRHNGDMLNRVEVILVRVTCCILLALTGLKLVFAKIEDLGDSLSREKGYRTNQKVRVSALLADRELNHGLTNSTSTRQNPVVVIEPNPASSP